MQNLCGKCSKNSRRFSEVTVEYNSKIDYANAQNKALCRMVSLQAKKNRDLRSRNVHVDDQVMELRVELPKGQKNAGE